MISPWNGSNGGYGRKALTSVSNKRLSSKSHGRHATDIAMDADYGTVLGGSQPGLQRNSTRALRAMEGALPSQTAPAAGARSFRLRWARAAQDIFESALLNSSAGAGEAICRHGYRHRARRPRRSSGQATGTRCSGPAERPRHCNAVTPCLVLNLGAVQNVSRTRRCTHTLYVSKPTTTSQEPYPSERSLSFGAGNGMLCS